MNKMKKGFTIVELVIVIAVIAILAAVLIPTFSNIIRSANESSDSQLVRNLNTILVTDKAANGKHTNYQQVLDLVDASGYDVAKIMKTKATDNAILWDSKNDIFCYLKGDEVVYIPNSIDGDPTKENVDLWKVYSDIASAEADTSGYSAYLAGEDLTGEISIAGRGIDVGRNAGITKVSYFGAASAQNVVIRTNSFDTKVEIDAPEDSVSHYGFSYFVDCKAIKEASYHEYGIVGRLKVTQGRAVAEAGSVVYCAMDMDGTATNAVVENAGGSVSINDENITDAEGLKTGDEGFANISKDSSSGVADGYVRYCKDDFHTYKELVIDSQHIYSICTCCGYVLNGAGVSYKNSDSTITEEQKETGRIEGIADAPVENNTAGQQSSCKHAHITYTENEDICVISCDDCDFTVNTTHNFDEHGDCVNCGASRVAYGVDTKKYYKSISSAYSSSCNIKMLKNQIYGSVNYIVPIQKEFTIDLNGHTIAAAGYYGAFYVYGGHLIIEDTSETASGCIYNRYASSAYNSLEIGNGGKVTLNGGNIGYTGVAATGVYVYGHESLHNELVQNGGTITGGSYAITVLENAIYTLNDGIVQAQGSVVLNNGTISTESYININGGKILGVSGKYSTFGIYQAGKCVTNITGGEIVADTGINIRAGSLNITGGKIEGLRAPTESGSNGNGPSAAGAGIAVTQHTTKYPITVNISDGEIKGYCALYEVNTENNTQEDLNKIAINITGGTFKATNNGTHAIYIEDVACSTLSGYTAEGLVEDDSKQ